LLKGYPFIGMLAPGGCHHVISIGQIIKAGTGVEGSYGYNTPEYLNPAYSIKDVLSYRLDWFCESPKFTEVNPDLKDKFCETLSSSIQNGIKTQFSWLEKDADQPDLILLVELKEVQGGYWADADRIRLILDLEVIRWGTVIAENEFYREFIHSQFFWEEGGAAESLFMKNADLLAKDIHQIVLDPSTTRLPYS